MGATKTGRMAGVQGGERKLPDSGYKGVPSKWHSMCMGTR